MRRRASARWARTGLAAAVLLGGAAVGAEPRAEDPAWRLVVEADPSTLAPRSVWLFADGPDAPAGTIYLWRCGDGDQPVETPRAQRGCRYDRPGRYRPSVVVRAPGAPDRAIRASEELAVTPRPPVTATIELRPSNRWWRAPLTVAGTVRVAGRLDDEPIESIAWLVDELPVGAGPAASLSVAESGAHRVAAVVRTPWRTVTATRVIEARPNRPPTCAIGQAEAEPPAPPATVRLTARCADPDGTVVAYRWTLPGGRTGHGPTVEWTADKGGRYPVRLAARDDAGAETEAETIVEWEKS
jgi:hypothetical protein